MATHLPQTEVYAFYQFLGQSIENGDELASVEESVSAFRAHQEEVERLRSKLAPSLEQAANGNAKRLDIDALVDRVTQRMSRESSIE